LIFALGIVTSISILGAFFMLAWLLNASPAYAWLGNALYVLFFVLNPLLVVFYLIVRLASPATADVAQPLAIQVAYIATFVSWWWLVATGIDHALTRKGLRHGAV
jgi:hypothetical protein